MCVDFDGELLIPSGDVGDFAVIACDQFSSCAEYWNELERVMPKGSALELILPECFLVESKERIARIESASRRLVDGGRFDAVRGAVAVTRKTKYGRTRRGIVASIDLDEYDYSPNSMALIRASEKTIEARIPPRVEIRIASDIELPHILLLVDDPDDLLMSAVDASKKSPLYDGELRGGGGHITGELIAAGDTDGLYRAVDELIDRTSAKYRTPLFALVGDGNHSLATAKFCYKTRLTPLDGRALVEIINIYDEGLLFEPIHRLVETDKPKLFIEGLREAVTGSAVTSVFSPDERTVSVPSDKVEAIVAIDRYCEDFVKSHGGAIEYVHGDGALRRDGHVGIKMRGIEKNELFGYVLENGVLPKKAFSLGEAEEKRFYVEARKIV